MMSRCLCVFVGAALLTPSQAIRKSRRKEAQELEARQPEVSSASCQVPSLSRRGETGTVDYVFSFGAPGTSSPALTFPGQNNGCFPGHRIWTAGQGTFGRVTDLVASVCNRVGFWHSKMHGEAVHEDRPEEDGFLPCGQDDDISWQPPASIRVSIGLHSGPVYQESTTNGKICPIWHNFTRFSSTAPMKDPRDVASWSPADGWRMVGYNWGSTLMQRPDTLECVVSFRGTDGHEEWIGNLQTKPTRFCGLVEEDEYCASTPCRTRKPGGAFTHSGFTDRLRRITQDSDWQENIRKHLPKCSKVYAVGHSAGGAMSELFQACVLNAPKPGEFGYDEDFKHISWVKDSAGRLPYI